jgi:hypothetical protein
MKQKFVADDGTEFDNANLCLAYERLIQASKNKAFHQTVESLFNGCTSWQGGHGMDDDSYKVFNIDHDMAKFKANLVRALPALRDHLDAALNQPLHQ